MQAPSGPKDDVLPSNHKPRIRFRSKHVIFPGVCCVILLILAGLGLSGVSNFYKNTKERREAIQEIKVIGRDDGLNKSVEELQGVLNRESRARRDGMEEEQERLKQRMLLQENQQAQQYRLTNAIKADLQEIIHNKLKEQRAQIDERMNMFMEKYRRDGGGGGGGSDGDVDSRGDDGQWTSVEQINARFDEHNARLEEGGRGVDVVDARVATLEQRVAELEREKRDGWHTNANGGSTPTPTVEDDNR